MCLLTYFYIPREPRGWPFNMNRINESVPQEFILLGFSRSTMAGASTLCGVLDFLYLDHPGQSSNNCCVPSGFQAPYPHVFFLAISLLDLCYTTSTVPQMLVNICSIRKVISYGGCVAFISLALGSTECLLLAVMSFDRFVAICWPLRYSVIMHQRLCLQLAAISWVSGFSSSVLQSTLTLQMPLCGHKKWITSSLEVPALHSSCACVDTTANEAELFFISVLFPSNTCDTHSDIICFYCPSSVENKIQWKVGERHLEYVAPIW